jgi:hypothetical protein
MLRGYKGRMWSRKITRVANVALARLGRAEVTRLRLSRKSFASRFDPAAGRKPTLAKRKDGAPLGQKRGTKLRI